MRDPKRIPRMAHKLLAIWNLQPDLRLGQLLVNMTQGGEPYIFHTEDQTLEDVLDDVLATYERTGKVVFPDWIRTGMYSL